MDAYKLHDGRVRVPMPFYSEGVLGDGVKDVDHDDPDAQKWIRWYAERGEVLPKLPVTNGRGEVDEVEQANTPPAGNVKFGRFMGVGNSNPEGHN